MNTHHTSQSTVPQDSTNEYKQLGLMNYWKLRGSTPQEYLDCVKLQHELRTVSQDTHRTELVCDICLVRMSYDSSG